MSQWWACLRQFGLWSVENRFDCWWMWEGPSPLWAAPFLGFQSEQANQVQCVSWALLQVSALASLGDRL